MQISCSRRYRLSALSAALLLAACSSPQKAPKKPQVVDVVTLKSSPYTQTISLPGRTTSFLTSPVVPQVTGVILKRLFTEGSEVKQGQVLYQIDPAPYQAAYDADKATLARAQAALLSAKPIAERNQKLAQIDAVSKETEESSNATLKQDEAEILTDQANLESARINLGYTQVKAPISGTISESTFTPGALVSANQSTAMATIYSYDPMYVDVTQSSTQVLQLRRDLANGSMQKDQDGGAKIQLTLEDGSTYQPTGSLQFAGVNVDESTGTITLRAIVPNPNKLLLPGMYVHATVVQGVNTKALLVPQVGITHDSRGNATAMIVDAQNKVEKRTVTTAGTSGSNWVITKGLNEGDRVIVQGLQFANEGDTVTPKESTDTTPGGSSSSAGANDSASAQ